MYSIPSHNSCRWMMILTLQVRKQLKAADPSLTYYAMTERLQALCPNWEDDKAVLDWINGDQAAVAAAVAELRTAAVKRDVGAMLADLSATERAALLLGLQ
jgi:hypothetical protein